MADDQAARRAEVSGHSSAQAREPEKQAKTLRVRVVEDGHPSVNVRVPIGVARWGMKMAQALSPEMKDAMIREGEQGKLVEDEVDHRTVEVWVE